MKQEVFLLNLTSLSCVVMPQRGPRTCRVLNYAVVEGSPMTELTPEERQRIYLEEKARLEVRRELEGQKTSARSGPALQVEFIGAAADLFFQIDPSRVLDRTVAGNLARNALDRLPIRGRIRASFHLRFPRNLLSSRGNGDFGVLAAGGGVSSRLACHAVLLTDTQLQEWSYIMNQRHARFPIAAIPD